MDTLTHMSQLLNLKTHNQHAVIAAIASASAALIVWRWTRKRSSHELPPGPPREFLIGGLRSMSATHQWLAFAEWSKKWGDVLYTSIMGRPIIIISTIESARELLDKRGANYSDRPHSVLQIELLDWKALHTLPYGERFRKHRRLISQILNSQAVVALNELQTDSAHSLLRSLMHKPEDLHRHILRQTIITVLRMTYGSNVSSIDDALVTLSNSVMDGIIAEGPPGFALVDLFPVIKYIPTWFPGASFQRRMAALRADTERMIDGPFQEAKSERKVDLGHPTLVGRLLDECDELGINDPEHIEDIKSVASIMYAGGVETTTTAMEIFFQMMAKHPEVVAQAHAEIDNVTGQERLPTLDDRKSLPIVDCIMREVFRINPPLPMALPHRNREDDYFEGKLIPAGSMILPNIWLMMHNPELYPEPNKFNPERFRSKVEKLEGNNLQVLNGLDKDDPCAIIYGFGRRICPGRYFVDSNLWILMSNILAVFDIGPPLDASGKPEVIGEVKFTSSVTSRPEPFHCTIKPRNQKCAELIQATGTESD